MGWALSWAVSAAATSRTTGRHVPCFYLGTAYAGLGEVEKAIEHYQEALVISRETGDRRGEANSLGNLGTAYEKLGDLVRAVDHWRQALDIFVAIRSPHAAAVRSWIKAAEGRP